jgi:hypothetical protein
VLEPSQGLSNDGARGGDGVGGAHGVSLCGGCRQEVAQCDGAVCRVDLAIRPSNNSHWNPVLAGPSTQPQTRSKIARAGCDAHHTSIAGRSRDVHLVRSNRDQNGTRLNLGVTDELLGEVRANQPDVAFVSIQADRHLIVTVADPEVPFSGLSTKIQEREFCVEPEDQPGRCVPDANVPCVAVERDE